MLDAFAMIKIEVFRDLGFVVGGLVDRDTDLAARGSHGLRFQPGQPAFDIEVTHLAEIEQVFVELGPFLHAPTMHVVGQVIDIGQAVANRIGDRAGNGDEIDIVDADVADRAGSDPACPVLAAPAIDKIDQRIADALDGGDVEFHRSVAVVETPGAKFERTSVGIGRIIDPQGDGADRRTMLTREALCKRILLGIDDEVDLTLAIQGHILVAVPCDGSESHLLEERAECFRFRRGIFDELEAVSRHRVVPWGELHRDLLIQVAPGR